MTRKFYRTLAIAIFASSIVFLSFGVANAQIQAAGGGYYRAGYPTIYGSFGQASVAQSRMYDQVKVQNRRMTDRDVLIKKWGLAAVEKAERETATKGVAPSNPQIVVSPPPVVRNYGVFRPDLTVDSGKALADALGSTPEEKALIEQIFASTKVEYEKEAASRGWKNNIAAGLTFFTVTAMTVYHDAQEPSEEAVQAYYKMMNVVLDEMPELGKAANKDKQGFNNMLIGFGGMLLAIYSEAKQNDDAATLEKSKKLAGMLIEMVLKTDPENLRLENGQIVMK